MLSSAFRASRSLSLQSRSPVSRLVTSSKVLGRPSFAAASYSISTSSPSQAPNGTSSAVSANHPITTTKNTISDMARPLYAFQDKLPHLPVPDLKETCAKYLRSVRPLLDDAAFARTESVVQQFQQPGGIGEHLQKRLQERAADTKVDNWLEEWWNELFFAFQDDRLRRTQALRAASIVTAAMDFREQVVSETLEPEYTKKSPLCSLAYHNIFNACLMRKNQVFVFDLVQNGKRLSTADIELQLTVSFLKPVVAKPMLLCMTTEHRDTWTDVRQHLLAYSTLSDDTAPVTRDEVSTACWHGDGLFETGKAGVIIEHSSVDGTPLSRLNDIVCDRSTPNTIGKHELSNLIKRFRMSPDAYVQMKYGTRKFKHGRTETCRTVSSDSIALLKPWKILYPPRRRGCYLTSAITSHVKYMSDAVEGQGVDRHLFVNNCPYLSEAADDMARVMEASLAC
ncbi:hypothetical protein BDF19DRAFT_431312 [Syncephalis fuscata]|nr:hypothetical protein BDF19DRAFT_431312 [Syncephalis fuscata]